jgi:hypothetical protein
MISQDAFAAEAVRGTYELSNPVAAGFDTEIVSMSLSAGPGQYLVGGQTFAVDSFFDVFTELSVSADPPTQSFRVDSFFDVFTEISVATPLAPAPSFGSGPAAAGSFDTEIVSLSLSGSASMNVTPQLSGGQQTGSWDTEMLSMDLTGSAPSTGGPITVRMGLPSPGNTTLTKVGDGRFQVDSFFDVFTEISIDGGPFQPAIPAPHLDFEQAPSGQRCDQFQGQLTTNGVAGGGSGWNNGQWIEYPNSGASGPAWHNQWFYNDPLDHNRFKEIFWDILLQPVTPGDSGDVVEVAINWSNDLYPDGSGAPPDPSAAGEAFIVREVLGAFFVDGDVPIKRLEGIDPPFVIPDYNPEWVSIDVRMLQQLSDLGVRITGEMCHECVPEPATMSLLAVGGLAMLRRRRRNRQL